MEYQSNLIFVYGTLLDESNTYGELLRRSSSLVGKAKLRGQLFDIGNYPGALPGIGDDDFIHGSVYRMNDVSSVLKELDDYEGFGADYQQPNEFVRQLAEVEIAEGKTVCWVYAFNWPVEGYQQIRSGDYLRYEKEGQDF